MEFDKTANKKGLGKDKRRKGGRTILKINCDGNAHFQPGRATYGQ